MIYADVTWYKSINTDIILFTIYFGHACRNVAE